MAHEEQWALLIRSKVGELPKKLTSEVGQLGDGGVLIQLCLVPVRQDSGTLQVASQKIAGPKSAVASRPRPDRMTAKSVHENEVNLWWLSIAGFEDSRQSKTMTEGYLIVADLKPDTTIGFVVKQQWLRHRGIESDQSSI